MLHLLVGLVVDILSAIVLHPKTLSSFPKLNYLHFSFHYMAIILCALL